MKILEEEIVKRRLGRHADNQMHAILGYIFKDSTKIAKDFYQTTMINRTYDKIPYDYFNELPFND